MQNEATFVPGFLSACICFSLNYIWLDVAQMQTKCVYRQHSLPAATAHHLCHLPWTSTIFHVHVNQGTPNPKWRNLSIISTFLLTREGGLGLEVMQHPECYQKYFVQFVLLGCCLTVDIYLFEVGGAKQKSPNSIQSLDPAYSHLLKQPQVFLHLQILQNQQQLTVIPKYVAKCCSDICLVKNKLLYKFFNPFTPAMLTKHTLWPYFSTIYVINVIPRDSEEETSSFLCVLKKNRPVWRS